MGKNFNLERIDKAYLIVVTEAYIDYKKDKQDLQFYFANIDKQDFPQGYDDLINNLRNALKRGTFVSLILERRPGNPNKKQYMDYLIDYHCE